MALIVCGAGPASHIEDMIGLAHDRAWSIRVVLSPAARACVDEAKLEVLTGEPVRSAHRGPGQARSEPVDVFVVAPATANTINKLAAGIADTYALDLLTEAVGTGQRVVMLPFVNAGLANRRPFIKSVEGLREEGVQVLLGPGQFEPHAPHTGSSRLATFPWSLALDAAEAD